MVQTIHNMTMIIAWTVSCTNKIWQISWLSELGYPSGHQGQNVYVCVTQTDPVKPSLSVCFKPNHRHTKATSHDRPIKRHIDRYIWLWANIHCGKFIRYTRSRKWFAPTDSHEAVVCYIKQADRNWGIQLLCRLKVRMGKTSDDWAWYYPRCQAPVTQKRPPGLSTHDSV